MSTQALIIGGTTGMGKATAELLVKEGTEVIIIGREGNNLTQAEQELSQLGKVKTIALDLSKPEEVKAFTSKLPDIAPQLKYVLNAAGFFSPKPFIEHEEADYEEIPKDPAADAPDGGRKQHKPDQE